MAKQGRLGLRLARAEYADRRTELLSLKSCQVTFLTFATTGAGVLLGYFATGSVDDRRVFLTPLVIVLPFWWCFFDKATTITRIVGYIRHLETMLIHRQVSDRFTGWENSLSRYRQVEPARNRRLADEASQGCCIVCRTCKRIRFVLAGPGFGGFLLELLLLTRHKYWVLVYWVFFWLGLLPLLMSGAWTSWTGRCCAGAFLISVLGNLYRLFHLIRGKNSYESCYALWSELLHERPARSS